LIHMRCTPETCCGSYLCMRLFWTTHLPNSPSPAGEKRFSDMHSGTLHVCTQLSSQDVLWHVPTATGSTTIRSPIPPALARCTVVYNYMEGVANGVSQALAAYMHAGSSISPNGDVPMDIVSAAILTNPASTNHTPGSRADPGSEICMSNTHTALSGTAPHCLTCYIICSTGSGGVTGITAAGLLRHSGDPKAGRSSCPLAPAPLSAAARTCRPSLLKGSDGNLQTAPYGTTTNEHVLSMRNMH
jgi:hypothetical protein